MSRDKRRCCRCGKTVGKWVSMFRYVFTDKGMEDRKITLCMKCWKPLENLLNMAEASIVTTYLKLRGVDVEKLPVFNVPSQPESGEAN